MTYLCAYHENFDNDYAVVGVAVDDQFLGCTRADRVGDYAIDVPAFGAEAATCDPEIYLVTFFCDENDAGPRSPAEVCVRINRPEVLEDSPKNRKILWSRTYDDVRVASGDLVELGWNLSCADRDGMDRDVDCSAARAALELGEDGTTNSNFGYTQEFVHALRAATQALEEWGTFKPNAANTLDFTCDGDACQDEINLYVHDARPPPPDVGPPVPPGLSGCEDRSDKNNVSAGYDAVCLTTPTNAFRVVHEIGHNVHRRWLVHGGSLADRDDGTDADCSGWDEDEDETCAVSEGWANFFSTASWYDEDAVDATYDTQDIEDPDSLESCASEPRSEGHVSQFFWDLHDGVDHADEDDPVNLPKATLLKVWSLFPDGADNHQNDEADDDDGVNNGRNAQDWYFWYESEYGDAGGEVQSLMEQNCTSLHAVD